MDRLLEWEDNMNAVIAHHRCAEGAWGKSDCWMMTMEAIEAMTGEKLLPKLRGYKSEKAGYRLFAKHGFDTVEDAIASVLTPVGILLAKRGDVGIVDGMNGPSCGIVTGHGLAVKRLYDDGTSGVEFLPVTQMTAAFKV